MSAHLPSPATQWTATQQPGSSLNFSFSRFSQSSTIWLEGGAPSSNGQSWRGRKREMMSLAQFLGNQNKRKCEGCDQLQGNTNVAVGGGTVWEAFLTVSVSSFFKPATQEGFFKVTQLMESETVHVKHFKDTNPQVLTPLNESETKQ